MVEESIRPRSDDAPQFPQSAALSSAPTIAISRSAQHRHHEDVDQSTQFDRSDSSAEGDSDYKGTRTDQTPDNHSHMSFVSEHPEYPGTDEDSTSETDHHYVEALLEATRPSVRPRSTTPSTTSFGKIPNFPQNPLSPSQIPETETSSSHSLKYPLSNSNRRPGVLASREASELRLNGPPVETFFTAAEDPKRTTEPLVSKRKTPQEPQSGIFWVPCKHQQSPPQLPYDRNAEGDDELSESESECEIGRDPSNAKLGVPDEAAEDGDDEIEVDSESLDDNISLASCDRDSLEVYQETDDEESVDEEEEEEDEEEDELDISEDEVSQHSSSDKGKGPMHLSLESSTSEVSPHHLSLEVFRYQVGEADVDGKISISSVRRPEYATSIAPSATFDTTSLPVSTLSQPIQFLDASVSTPSLESSQVTAQKRSKSRSRGKGGKSRLAEFWNVVALRKDVMGRTRPKPTPRR